MDIVDPRNRPDFIRFQVHSTRGISPGWFNDWFTGGLNYQVEHHLLPDLPRHNLGKVRSIVREFCKKHDVKFHETGLWQGNMEVLQHLSSITKALITEFPAM